MIGALPPAGLSIIFRVGMNMKKVAEVFLRIFLGKKWRRVGMEN